MLYEVPHRCYFRATGSQRQRIIPGRWADSSIRTMSGMPSDNKNRWRARLWYRAYTKAHKDFKSDTDNDIECIGCHTEATRSGSVSTGMNSQPTTISGLTIG